MPEKSILIFIDWFYPAYKAGGPVKSVFNLVQALQGDFDFSLVTCNRDVDGEVLDVKTNEWTEFRGIPIIYLTKEKQRRKIYRALLEEKQADCIYYNSLFSKNFLLKPYRLFKQYDVKQIISPRGMFGEGSLAVKARKKKAFLYIAKKYFFEKEKTVWHSTSEQERQDIIQHLGNEVKIHLAQNLPSKINSRSKQDIQKVSGELRLVFVARILPIKNLLFALDLFQNLPHARNLTLDIYGPIEEQVYWRKCEKIIEKDARIQYKGVLKPHEIAAALQQHHFYILPTQHENYGHSIVEALLAGLPIMISQATPWRALQSAGVGADLDLNKPKD
ncbi:MAG: glycosyltransferase, partial [Candidatus Paceibacterota bacterium]